LRERWAIPPGLRAAAMQWLSEILQDPDARHREKTAAVRAMLAASKINLENVSVTIKAQMHEQVESELDDVKRQVKECVGG
jgi:hypothetical protein